PDTPVPLAPYPTLFRSIWLVPTAGSAERPRVVTVTVPLPTTVTVPTTVPTLPVTTTLPTLPVTTTLPTLPVTTSVPTFPTTTTTDRKSTRLNSSHGSIS